MLNIRYALGGRTPCRELWLVQEKPSPLPQGTHHWLGQESGTAETAGWQCWAVSYDMSEGVARTAELEGHTGEAGESLKMRRA